MAAAGVSVRQWATVRCSYCGGMGRVWVEVQEEEEKQPDQQPEEQEGEQPQEEEGKQPEDQPAEGQTQGETPA